MSKMKIPTVTKGWQGLLMVIGTSRFFLFADFMFLYEAMITPFFTAKKFPRPAPEFVGIAVILIVSSIISPHPIDGLQTAFRVVLLATVLPAYRYGFWYKKAAALGLMIIAILVVVQSGIFLDNRPDGIHFNAVSLAMSAFVFMPIFWYEIALAGAIILVVSLSRTPVVALMIFAVLSRRRYYIGVAAVTGAMFLVYGSVVTPGRITTAGIDAAIIDRIETVTGHPTEVLDARYKDKICGDVRPIQHLTYGYGFYGFCESTGQPRPHNIYVLSFYELGILFLPFWALVMYAARRLSYIQILPLLALGLVNDDLFGRPEGVYLIAAWLISTTLMRENHVTRPNPTHTASNPQEIEG